jgi:Fungal chitosanase of glycosyl hydrolase group 75/D-alanyl-D-alanine carboxypeptidase
VEDTPTQVEDIMSASLSASLNDLVPEFRTKVDDLLAKCVARGVRMVPNETVRTPAQQAIYWRQSRSTSQINDKIDMLRSEGASYLAGVLDEVGPQHGDPVTQVLPGNSWHQWGEAIDCFWEVDGEAEWSTTRKVNGVNGYRVYAEEADNMGLTAGLLWPHFKDAPHVQMREANNPKSSGKSWTEIDQTMRDRFGSDVPAPPLGAGMAAPPAAHDPIRLSFSAPEGWSVFETTDVNAAVFRAKMAIDADGAPKAYNSNDSIALDSLVNAGRPGNWFGVVTDTGRSDGEPVVQKQGDPAPGFFVSATTLTNPGFARESPLHYVDADTIPFVALPGGGRFSQFTSQKVLRLGDLGVAFNKANGKMCFAMFVDIGPSKKIGEGSIALARALGIPPSPKTGGTDARQVVYVVFASTGVGRGLTVQEINDKTQPIFDSWGGLGRLSSYGNL